MKYKHILWDWNGTIINDAALCVSIINKLLTEHHFPPITEEEYKKKFIFPVAKYYENLGFNSSQFKILSDKFAREYNIGHYTCKIFPGLHKLLEKNKNADIKQSVLSASKQETLQNIISHLKLNKYFKHIAGISDSYAAGKIERGKILMKTIDAAPHEMLMIGDTHHDMEVANALGIHHVLVSHGHASIENLKKLTDKIAHSIDDLEKIIFNLD